MTSRWTDRKTIWRRLVSGFEPWGIVLTPIGVGLALIGVAIALITIMVDLDDRQSERTFRAWQLVLADRAAGSSQREAVEHLNRQFDGFVCEPWVNSISIRLTGNHRRKCLLPGKERASFENIVARGAVLTGANLTAVDMRRADLMNANLSRANLSRAVLLSADIRGANLSWANLRNAFLMYADMRQAIL